MKPTRAFTLVELFIVVTILGLLAAMAVPAYHKVKNRVDYVAKAERIRYELTIYTPAGPVVHEYVRWDPADQAWIDRDGVIVRTGEAPFAVRKVSR